MEAILHPDIRILSIATRPDCLSTEILDLLERLNQIKPVWVELGLQTIHEKKLPVISEEAMIFRYSRPLYLNFADGE